MFAAGCYVTLFYFFYVTADKIICLTKGKLAYSKQKADVRGVS